MDFSKLDLNDHQKLARAIISEAALKSFNKRSDFEKFRNGIVKKNRGEIFHNLYLIKAYNDLLKEGEIKPNESLLNLIQKRSVRTLSGVAPVTVLTKPFACLGRCIYCPTDVRMPKSYLPSQPAAQRAFRQRFNPYTQVFVRLKALHITGHEVSKVELRVIGGTWSSYPKRYQTWFIKQCLMAMNEFYDQVCKEIVTSHYGVDRVNTVILKPLIAQRIFADVVRENETAKVRCIGMNVETRPDFITEKEIKRLRSLGVTKIEIGVQTTDDRVQEITKRGHDLKSVKKATALLKDAGFKLSYHMMPNLPGSTIELDKRMIGDLFNDEAYQPDYLKIYPCMVIPGTELAEIYEQGGFKPYDDKTLEDVLYAELKSVPEWCRIDRVARDIPAPDILAGSKVSNIRQILEERLKREGTPCRDIRSREIGREDVNLAKVELIVREYKASGGREFFISYDDVSKDKIIGLIRLRFPNRTFLFELAGCALIREVHVYGRQLKIGEHRKSEKQHIGWGIKLMQISEKYAKEAGYKKMAVISGIGTREYYRKNGYSLRGTYMVKDL